MYRNIDEDVQIGNVNAASFPNSKKLNTPQCRTQTATFMAYSQSTVHSLHNSL